jgi:hypothetical protein
LQDTETLAAAKQLLATGRSRLLSQITGLRVEDNLFGTVPNRQRHGLFHDPNRAAPGSGRLVRFGRRLAMAIALS